MQLWRETRIIFIKFYKPEANARTAQMHKSTLIVESVAN